MEDSNNSSRHDVQREPIRPAALPIKCPVCNGFGTCNYGKITCGSCKGKGYILVPVEKREEK